MAFREGQVYRCVDPACGCEVTVTKSAPPDCRHRQPHLLLRQGDD